MIRTIVTTAPFSPDAELSQFSATREVTCGAVASFVGYCRGQSGSGPVTQLELQSYPGFTEAEIARLATEVAQRHGLIDVLVIHRTGVIEPHAPIVLVAAMSAHRSAAFAAVEQLMDYLKTDAPFWKRETGPGGARWIEPTAEDRARRMEHEP